MFTASGCVRSIWYLVVLQLIKYKLALATFGGKFHRDIQALLLHIYIPYLGLDCSVECTTRDLVFEACVIFNLRLGTYSC